MMPENEMWLELKHEQRSRYYSGLNLIKCGMMRPKNKINPSVFGRLNGEKTVIHQQERA